MKRIPLLIIGAGPTGLGAAWRAQEIGRPEWLVLEAAGHAGGLASSFVDEKGFTWDVGGHVQFSHYEYFDQVMDRLLGRDGWLEHDRESWVWIRDRFVPYPFQNNIHRLPDEDYERCFKGLAVAAAARENTKRPEDFREWILATAGRGIADLFLFPYNFKVWAYPPERLSATWVGERVAVPDLERIRQNKTLNRDDVSWGPNNRFRFPRHGGTGSIWRACAAALPAERLRFNTAVTAIDLAARRVMTASGETFEYETLLSTPPLRELVRVSGQQELAAAERGLVYSSSNIFGIGLRGTPPETLRTKCWMYFPENNCPFYRVTVFSNYSPNNVPDITRSWSLMAEVSESPVKAVNHATIEREVIDGLLATKLIHDRADVISFWRYRAGFGYPTPVRERDAALSELLPFFEERGVYPRGRFGLWKYEVSNQDHSFMQGVELVERLMHGHTEITAPTPNVANARKHPWPFAEWKMHE